MQITKVTIEMIKFSPSDRRMVFTVEDDEGRKLDYTEMLWESDSIDVISIVFSKALRTFHAEYDKIEGRLQRKFEMGRQT